MKNQIKILFYLMSLILFLTAIVSCNDSTGSDKNNDPETSEASTYVKTIPLTRKSFVDYISVLGVAKALYQANLSSDEGGRIKEFVRDKGKYVNKGDVILIMDNDVLKANLDAASAQYERAESTFVRQEKVFKEKVTSELTYLNSKFERDAAKANCELIKARYDRTFIKAPFSGIVDMKYSEIGETVLPGAPIVSLVNIDKIKMAAGVPENYVNMVKVGSNVVVTFKDLDDIMYNAVVSYVGHTISTNNRTFPIEILLENSNGKIKPELSARLQIEKANYKEVFVIPEETVTETDLGPVVFIEKDGVVQMRIIEIISRSKNKIAINKGIKEGENLVTVGFQNLVDGEKVTVIK